MVVSRTAAYRARPFVCNPSVCEVDSCGKRFERRHDLNRHIRVHLNIRDYACKFCKERFAQKNGLDVHERGHFGLRTHACPLSKTWGKGDCEVLPFRDDSSYRRHWQNKHAKNPPRYPCPVSRCNFIGGRKALLRNHMREQHNKDLPPDLKERQPRGAHGIEVPPAVIVTVYDTDLEARGFTRQSTQGRRRRTAATRASSYNAATNVVRSPSYEAGDLSSDSGFPSDTDSVLETPTSFTLAANTDSLPMSTNTEKQFSLRVPSPPPPHANLFGNRVGGLFGVPSVSWPPSSMVIPEPPMVNQSGSFNGQATAAAMAFEALSMALNGYNTMPAPEPFAVLNIGPYTAASSPIPSFGYDEPEFMTSSNNPRPGSMDFGASNVPDDSWMSMIDPALLLNDGAYFMR